MKVLLANTLYDPYIVGGAERSVQLLAEALLQAGHEVVVVSTRPEPKVQVVQVNGVKVYYVGLRNVYWPFGGRKRGLAPKILWHAIDTHNLAMAHAIKRILDIEQPALVHTNNLAGLSVAVWWEVKKIGLPLVHTLRDYYLLCPRATMFRNGRTCETQCWDCMLYSLLRRQRSNLVDAVVGISHHILARHLAFGCFGRTPFREVIFNAYSAPPSRQSRTAEIGERLRLGFLGQLRPNKGVELLIKGLHQIPGDRWELWVGGKGPDDYERYLRSRYNLRSVQFLGFVRPEVFFPKIDVLLVPSIWCEPLGRTVLEAYAYGVPVIASNRGGIPEILEDGKTGFVFDPSRPETLRLAIERFLHSPDLVRSMRQNILEKSKIFSPERICAQYLRVYTNVVGHIGGI
jgi:glycosyltransferase involved in cell wall biosynthesis